MLYGAIRNLLSTVTLAYFKEISVKGKKKIPFKTPVIFCSNHPSGLLDPLVLMHVTRYEFKFVSSVAKHSLFSAPLIGFIIKQMKAIPVMKAYDPDLPTNKQPSEKDRAKMNEKMFEICVKRICEENTSIILFPEGETYTRPSLQELKSGAARLAITLAKHADASGTPRIPIVPVGLIYSHPSGYRFRQSVLVDFGHPIHISDEQMKIASTGEEGERKIAKKITTQLLQHLKEVTINLPDWIEELEKISKVKGFATPEYSSITSTDSNHVGVMCKVDRMEYVSKFYEPILIRKTETNKDVTTAKENFDKFDEDKSGTIDKNEFKKLCITKGYKMSDAEIAAALYVMDSDKSGTIDFKEFTAWWDTIQSKKKEKMTLRQKRQAARKAFFALSGIDAEPTSDWEIINTLHMVRRLYKPDDAKMTFPQYARLTQNFIDGYFMVCGEDKVKSLWRDVSTYEKKINALGIKDTQLKSRGEEEKIKKDAIKKMLQVVVLLPLSVIGEIIHAPTAGISYILGKQQRAIDEAKANDGDRSVEATMKMVGGFAGVVIQYPIICFLAYHWTQDILAVPLAISFGVTTGLAAIHLRPSITLIKSIKDSARILANKDEISNLKKERMELKTRIREAVNDFAPYDMQRVFTSFMTENIIPDQKNDDLNLHKDDLHMREKEKEEETL